MGLGASKLSSIINPYYSLKTVLGQAGIIKVDHNTYDVVDTYDFNDQGKGFGLIGDIQQRGASPYTIARSLGRNYGSGDGRGGKVKVRIKLKD